MYINMVVQQIVQGRENNHCITSKRCLLQAQDKLGITVPIIQRTVAAANKCIGLFNLAFH